MSRIAFALVLAALSACGGERDEIPAELPGDLPPPKDASMTPPQGDSVTFTIEVPARARAGEAVPVVLRLANPGAQPATLYLQGREMTFDVEVALEGGAVVWRRLEGETLQSILRIETLAPGETRELRAEWNGRTRAGAPAPPGRYTVRGLLPSEDGPLVAGPAPLELAL